MRPEQLRRILIGAAILGLLLLTVLLVRATLDAQPGVGGGGGTNAGSGSSTVANSGSQSSSSDQSNSSGQSNSDGSSRTTISWNATRPPYRILHSDSLAIPNFQLLGQTNGTRCTVNADSGTSYYKVIDGNGRPVSNPIITVPGSPASPAPDPGAGAGSSTGDSSGGAGGSSSGSGNYATITIPGTSDDPEFQHMIDVYNRPVSPEEQAMLQRLATQPFTPAELAQHEAVANTPLTQEEIDRWNAQYASPTPFGAATDQIQGGIVNGILTGN